MPHRFFDHLEVRCPQLGGPVTFGYCRALEEGLPCPRALVCFAPQFPVDEFFRRILEAETYERVFLSPREGRAERLLRLLLPSDVNGKGSVEGGGGRSGGPAGEGGAGE